jgi:hypothetical protein
MMKLVRYLRSLDDIPKWLIFVSLTGSTWFFGLEVWFRVPPMAALVALVTYWVLFGFKKDS